MEVGKKHLRGGLLHLFDWNGKSRKKLFPNNAETSRESERGKPVENRLKSQPYTMDGDAYNGASGTTCCPDFSSASSVTSDEGCGSRAPGLVARLMGLHSLPTPNVSELSSTTYSASRSCQPMGHTGTSNKLDRSSSSPIEPRFCKSPGFIPTKNAAYILEAAAKIIEVGPRKTSDCKLLPFGSSSVPLKIRDLKGKIEAAHKVSRPQRPDQPSQSVAKSSKEQHKGKSHIKSDSEKGSSNSLRNKGKPVSLAEQSRVNVRRKEESFSSDNESPANPKHSSRGSADARNNVENGTANTTNNVLRQNNQKQNCLSNRDKWTSKTSTLDQQGRKARSVNGRVRLSRTISKVTVNSESQSRNMRSSASGPSKELLMSRQKNSSRKKQLVNEDLLSGKPVSKISSMNGGERNQLQLGSDPSGDNDPLVSKSSGFSVSDSIIGGDDLSVIVGKKLEELTYRVESSNCNIILEETSSSPASSQKTSELPLGTLTTTTSTGHHERLQLSEEIEDRNASESSSETAEELDLQHPSPLSTLKLAAMSECSADSRDSGTSGTMHLAPDEEVLSSSPVIESSQIVGETDGKLPTTTSKSTDLKESANSDLDYVKMVLKDSELKFIEYTLGQTDNIVTLNAFGELEHWNGTEGHSVDHSKLELKLLLDCVSESLESRYDQVFVGSCKGWAKWG
ncbi:uncharacterized protein LOC120158910 [Hibiscus syriacus]|uniref:uncharacterized protein LOC120158910 n=1 Tax=Hibiscus syriacus TaxID=106335 RepID=UPI001923D872|nr:uncharacterized protein LOC120158910 [Hibiscus syriacus]